LIGPLKTSTHEIASKLSLQIHPILWYNENFGYFRYPLIWRLHATLLEAKQYNAAYGFGDGCKVSMNTNKQTGELGVNGQIPNFLTTTSNFVQIAAGYQHTLALNDGAQVYSFGQNCL
jgi:alpha-tubulin suppressor-like RCC1 family protein